MRLMNGICILVAELVEDCLDSGVVIAGYQLPDRSLKPVSREQLSSV
jgi:hypothetical protein